MAEALSRKALASCDEVSWDDIRMKNSSLDGSAKRVETFRVEQDRGEERQVGGEPVREQQKKMAWMIQFKPQAEAMGYI